MIHIETVKLKEHNDYNEMKTEVNIKGTGEVIEEEIKTLLLRCLEEEKLAPIVLSALREVKHDN